ncbi:unnamed protein product [Orchesella dallaii]|uniref:Uncharacterized protein n=1 Tax=Orchesella dallaii TaxID=48710 RepID=A0ABP1SAV1_9HEXA
MKLEQYFKRRPAVLYASCFVLGEKLEVTTSASCTNLPDEFQLTEGSLMTSGCVAIYAFNNCYNGEYGIIFTLEKTSIGQLLQKFRDVKDFYGDGIYYPKGFKIWSLRDCTELEQNPFADMDYYVNQFVFYEENYFDNDRRRVEKFRNICECTRLPNFDDLNWQHAALTHGNCFKFYKSVDCSGEVADRFEILEKNYIHEGRQSFEPCHIPTACANLKANIFNLEPAFDLSNLDGTLRDVAIDVKQTFINDGPGVMEEAYEVERVLTERAEFHYSKAFKQLVSNANSVETTSENGTETNYGGKLSLGFKAAGKGTGGPSGSALVTGEASEKITEEFRTGLTNAFQNDSEATIGNKAKYGIETTRTFRVEKQILVQPCISYDVVSFIKIAEDVKVVYRVLFEITGVTKNGTHLTIEDLRLGIGRYSWTGERLVILDGHVRENNETLVAESNVILQANYGLNSVVDATGELIKVGKVNLSTGILLSSESMSSSDDSDLSWALLECTKLMLNKRLDLTKAVEIAKHWETVKKQQGDLHGDGKAKSVEAVGKKQRSTSSSKRDNQSRQPKGKAQAIDPEQT